jgi:hypothetical protein
MVVAALVLAGLGVTIALPTSAPNGATGVCTWQATRATDPHPALYDRFDSVAALTARDAWAVGSYFTGREGGAHGAFVERWSGRVSQVVAIPIRFGASLWSVAASTSRDVWAVGQRDNGGPLIEHWNGVRWGVVASPRVRGGLLWAVAASAPDDAWAVGVRDRGATTGGGRTLVEHWDGRRWGVIPSPSPKGPNLHRPYAVLRAVAAISPSDVWAVGTTGDSAPATVGRTLVEHWDGRRWTIVPSPNVRSATGVVNNMLFSISGTRADDVWAVGSWGDVAGGYGGRGDHALALRWDGRRWSRVATPEVGKRSLLSGVVALPNAAWAVGSRDEQPHQQTLIERWDGVRWSVAPSPPGFALNAISASAGSAWAVGSRDRQPLAARC